MKLIHIVGSQNSGKTTLIRALIRTAYERNDATAAVIVNEEGDASYDEDFVRTHNVSVTYLRGG